MKGKMENIRLKNALDIQTAVKKCKNNDGGIAVLTQMSKKYWHLQATGTNVF